MSVRACAPGRGGECCVLSRDQPVCPLPVRVFVVVAAAALLFTHRGSLTRLFTHRTAPHRRSSARISPTGSEDEPGSCVARHPPQTRCVAHIEPTKKKKKKGEDAEVRCGGSVRRADGTGECSRCLLGSLSGLTGPPPEAAPRTFLHLPRTLRVSPAGGSRAARCRITPHCLHASFFFSSST